MKKIIIIGEVANSEGCTAHITVTGPNLVKHFDPTDTAFNIPLSPLQPGTYLVNVKGVMEGILTITFQGDVVSSDPPVPKDILPNISQTFIVKIGTN